MISPKPNRILYLIAIAGGLLAVGFPLAAQDAPEKADPPADTPTQTENQAESQLESESEPESDPLDLDDLLRLPGSDAPIERPAEDADQPDTELDRILTGRQVQEFYIQAVQEMNEVADRLTQLRDSGVVTQRLQQDIITKLDILIKSSDEQSSSSSSSSSSSQQQQQQPGQQQSQQSQTPGQSPQSGDTMPPGGQAEELNQNLDLSVAEWGNLPERLRQSLIQGQSDYFSDMYRRWTESYYRRLAEEAGR